jgi:maltose alpha-D-glucosyltransferase/alpha-amylase
MIRSFHYAAHVAMVGRASTVLRPEDMPRLEEWANAWYIWVSATFLRTYLELMADTPILPQGRESMKIVLDAFLIDKAIYEVKYELNNRPDWLTLPLKGILQVLGTESLPEKAGKEASEPAVKAATEAEQNSENMSKEPGGKAKKEK